MLSTSCGTFYMEPGFSLRRTCGYKTVFHLLVFVCLPAFGKVGWLWIWVAGQRENWLCDWISGSRGREFHREGSQAATGCHPNATHSTLNWRQDHGKRHQVCATLSLRRQVNCFRKKSKIFRIKSNKNWKEIKRK